MPRKAPEKTVQAAHSLDPCAFALAEYSSLRAELLKYRDYQHQIIQLAFIAAGTFFSLNAGAGMRPIVLLAYPVLALFLSLGWASNTIRVKRINLYI